jgi:ribokinase
MIVVFGSINIDLVARVSALPRAGETVAGPDYQVIPGGKGANQALAARRAGADVIMVGAVGRGRLSRRRPCPPSQPRGVDVTRVTPADAPHRRRLHRRRCRGAETRSSWPPGRMPRSGPPALDGLSASPRDILLLQWEVPEAEVLAAARWAKAREMRVMLNRAPAGADLRRTHRASRPRRGQRTRGAGVLAPASVCPMAIPMRVAAALSERHDLAVAVTLGAEGALCWADGIRHESPAYPVAVGRHDGGRRHLLRAPSRPALDRRRGLETAGRVSPAAGRLPRLCPVRRAIQHSRSRRHRGGRCRPSRSSAIPTTGGKPHDPQTASSAAPRPARKLLGAWVFTGSPAACEIYALAGYDIVPHRHRAHTARREGCAGMRAGGGGRRRAMPWCAFRATIRATSSGCSMPASIPSWLPMVDTVEQAHSIVRACLYPPRGTPRLRRHRRPLRSLRLP